MTKSTASYVNASVASGGAYVGFQGVLSAQLNAVLTKTADTGQITNFNVNPVATVRDFEVFRFTDTLQATAPIFVKANYAYDASGFTYLGFTVGTATNGAGTLFGITTPILQVFGAQPQVSQTRYCYTSSDGSQLVFGCNLLPNVSANVGYGDSLAAIVIERTRDADGTANGNGYMVYQWKSFSDLPVLESTHFMGCLARIYDSGATQPNLSYDYGVQVPNAATVTSGLNGTGVTAYPMYGFTLATASQGASKALMLGHPGDYLRDQVVTLNHYGTTMNFLALPQEGANVAYQSAPGTAATRALCPLLRWE